MVKYFIMIIRMSKDCKFMKKFKLVELKQKKPSKNYKKMKRKIDLKICQKIYRTLYSCV
jgi:hypothetical protein